jgi:hypothetical protein
MLSRQAAPVFGAAFLLLASLPPALIAAPALDAAQAQASSLELQADPGWHALIHHEARTLGTGTRSTVSSDWFFLADNGHRDPRAELHATLGALAENPEIGIREEAAACVFSARRAWLAERLDLSSFPEPACPRRDEWLAALNAQKAWLVFPSAYLNSPASMFGHTLLRIDGTAGSEESPLLAYAVNFAAETDETNGLVFAFKGLTGGYRGQFSVMPYYEKVREYSRLESRDLWEYPLNLDAEELHRVMLHLWELRGVEFDYYFFTKNCSYQLLTLLETGRHGLHLRGGLDWWAIPTDTIRALDQVTNLIGTPTYRPALATLLAHRGDQISEDLRQQAVAIGRGRQAPDALDPDLPAQTRARTLDVAHDWLYYRFQAGRGQRDDALPRGRRILGSRAATGTRSDFDPPPKPDTAPDRGHGTRRIAVGGFAEADGSGLQMRLRPAYHDLLDPPGGYGDGNQIAFADLTLAADLENDRLRLRSLDLIDIISLAPRDTLFNPISWRVATGARRLGGLDDPLAVYLEGGPGLSWRTGPGMVYGFLTAEVDAQRRLDKGYVLGGGGRVGALWPLSPTLRAQMELRSRNPLAGGDFEQHKATLATHWAWTQDWGLRLEGGVARENGDWTRRAELMLVHHFGPRF